MKLYAKTFDRYVHVIACKKKTRNFSYKIFLYFLKLKKALNFEKISCSFFIYLQDMNEIDDNVHCTGAYMLVFCVIENVHSIGLSILGLVLKIRSV